MKTLAVDPGYDRIGVAVVEKPQNTHKEVVIFSTCIETDSKKNIHERIFDMGTALEQIIQTYSPTRFAIETIFHTHNSKTVIGVSEARGVCMYIAHKYAIPVFEYGPPQIKTAVTGYGKATKKDVLFMVEKLVTLPNKKRIDDEIDAIAIALTDLAHSKLGTHISTLAKKTSF